MGMGRKPGTRSPGFIESILDLVESFYGGVVQQITPWQPPAPKLKQSKPTPEVDQNEQRLSDPFRWVQERPDAGEDTEVF
jgi:hypothetical protein